jgi:hypothetical protein
MNHYEYVGNLHIHSLHSDGAENIPGIAKAAAGVGLDFVCLNDHDFLTDRLYLEEEGFYNNVLLLVGLEIGKRHHHYLAYDLIEKVAGDNLAPQEVIDLVNKQGGFGFLAHPFEKGMPFRQKSVAYTWNDLLVKDYTGICIWNFSSRWKERIKSPAHGIFYLLFKHSTLKGPSQETLSFWDAACRARRVTGIGGSDAHATDFKWGPITFRPFTYEVLLNTINIHVLLRKKLPPTLDAAKKEIYGALRSGRLFTAHDGLCQARGFRFDFIADKGPGLAMGEEGSFQKGALLIRTPRRAKIRLIRDGAVVEQWLATGARYRVDGKGVYRVEVFCKVPLFGWRPWIFSNPIYLR